MMCSLDRKGAHLPLDHTRIATVSAFQIDFITHLNKQQPIMIFTIVMSRIGALGSLSTGAGKTESSAARRR